MYEKRVIGKFKVQRRNVGNSKHINHFVTLPELFHDAEEVIFEQDHEGVVTIRENSTVPGGSYDGKNSD